MPLAGFEPTIPASERSQTHALDHAVTGIGITNITIYKQCVEGVVKYKLAVAVIQYEKFTQ